jgi:16S rRNA processing protein RimM
VTKRERLLIGKISGAFGIKGELKLFHFSGDSERLSRLSELRCAFAGEGDIRGSRAAGSGHGNRSERSADGDRAAGSERDYKVISVRMQRKTPILRLAGIDDRSGAEALVGAEVFAFRDELAPADGESFFVEDILGVAVLDRGRRIGRVSNFIDNPAHGILEVETDGGEKLLVPLVDVFIKSLSIEKGEVETDLSDMEMA